MVRTYRKFDHDFRQGTVWLVFETGRLIVQVARELEINEGTLGNWCTRVRGEREHGDGALSETGRAELARLRRENTELGRASATASGSTPAATGAPGYAAACSAR
jgi:transposase